MTAAASPRPKRNNPWRTPILLWLLGAAVTLSAVARLVSMAQGAAMDTLPDDHVDKHYLQHAIVVLLHLVPGLAFVLLGPVQFSTQLRKRYPKWHNRAGKVFVVSGIIAGVSALWMNQTFPPVGGILKYTSNVAFGVTLIGTLMLAMAAIWRRRVGAHRAWMMRAFAIGTGVATQRVLLVPLFIAFGDLSDTLIGAGTWAGWLLNVAVAEILIRRSRRGARATRSATTTLDQSPA